MRIQITGSREFTDRATISNALTPWLSDAFRSREPVTVVHGAAQGADTLAGEAIRDLSWVDVEVHRPEWGKYGKAAGQIRNVKMLDAGRPDVVLAFFKRGAGNRGTQNMVNEARLRGLNVIEYWED